MIRLALLIFGFLAFSPALTKAQILSRAEQKFHQASALYIDKDYDNALSAVKEGLKASPRSQKLEELRKLLEQEQKKQQQQEQQQQKKDQQKKDQEKKDQQQKEEDNKEKGDQEEKEKQPNDQEKKDQENKDQQGDEKDEKKEDDTEKEPRKPENQKADPSEKLEEMNMSEEKARMILEAMKNQEMQYLQQQKRKPTQPRDRNKPDW